jgi:hypothetical protein
LAVRECWHALWRSRLLVWTAGVGVVLLFGFGPHRTAFNPPGLSSGFGWLGNLLAAPAARWDANWYLVIAHYGYHPGLGAYTASRDAFFPLYPLGIGALGALGVPAVAGGVVLSIGALALALYGLHRLTALELGEPGTRLPGRERDVTRLAVYVCALAPMAFFLSAVYSESLYLVLSIALFWSARQGRWGYVGVLGALAGATRSTGLVLALPAVMLYLYGPRRDRVADFARAGRARLLPRYRLRREALWLALLPAGAVAYGAYLGLAGGDPLAPFNVQQAIQELVADLPGGEADYLDALRGAPPAASFSAHLYFPAGGKTRSWPRATT